MTSLWISTGSLVDGAAPRTFPVEAARPGEAGPPLPGRREAARAPGRSPACAASVAKSFGHGGLPGPPVRPRRSPPSTARAVGRAALRRSTSHRHVGQPAPCVSWKVPQGFFPKARRLAGPTPGLGPGPRRANPRAAATHGRGGEDVERRRSATLSPLPGLADHRVLRHPASLKNVNRSQGGEAPARRYGRITFQAGIGRLDEEGSENLFFHPLPAGGRRRR